MKVYRDLSGRWRNRLPNHASPVPDHRSGGGKRRFASWSRITAFSLWVGLVLCWSTGRAQPVDANLLFSGEGDSLLMENAYRHEGAFALSAWLHMPYHAFGIPHNQQTLFWNGGGSSENGLYLGVHTRSLGGGKVREIVFQFGDGQTGKRAVGGQVPLDEWLHVHVQWAQGHIEGYLNGEQVFRAEWQDGYQHNDAVPIQIGARRDEAGNRDQFFWGMLADFAIWERSLSVPEIRNAMDGLQGDEDGLTGYWPMTEGLGDVAPDRLGKNPGLFEGTPQWVLWNPFERDLVLEEDVRLGDSLTLGPVRLRDPQGEVAYQWFFNGQMLDGETGASLSLPGVTDDRLGTYFVQVDDARPVTPVASSGVRVSDLHLIPWPESVERVGGRLTLGEDFRIVIDNSVLKPLAGVVAREFEALFGLQPAIARGTVPEEGNLLLGIDPTLDEEQYRMEVKDRVRVSGGGYAGVAAGTVTFLQSLTAGDGGVGLPLMEIRDAPYASFRGLLVDPARRFHPPATLREIIDLCRWYKIRYLQLHLTDDQSFTFPSQAYPKLATPGRHYTVEQLRELEQYAVERGVLIVPEFEMPGHAGAMTRKMPELFATQTGRGSTMNYARPEACEALDTIIGEMIDVFRATPYFHIGADEVNFSGLDRDPDFRTAMEQTGLPSPYELYRAFIVDRNEAVKRHGKQMIIWEGFRPGGETEIPRDILVMAFEGGDYFRPDHLVEKGYTIINTSWQPLYVVTGRPAPVGQWPVEHIYNWNLYRFEHFRERCPAYEPILLPAGAPILGAMMCSWANPADVVVPFLRERLAAMSERIWNPAAGRDFQDFSQRLRRTDAALERLLQSSTDVLP